MKYPSSSPYYLTETYRNQFLDIMIDRPIPKDPMDIYWQITQTYSLRPDLLAFDLYNDAGLWWVFAQRNPNRLKDPVFDFKPGIKIYIPKKTTLQAALG